MMAHKKYLMAFDQVCQSQYVLNEGNPQDELRNRHMTDAVQYIRTHVQDSLASYKDVANLHDCLSTKDAKGELSVNNYEEVKEEDVKATIATALLSALFGLGETSEPEHPNYTKEYVLAIADLLQQQFNAIDIAFDYPKFQSQTADCITYSVYCPTDNERYTLTLDKKTNEYSWDVGNDR